MRMVVVVIDICGFRKINYMYFWRLMSCYFKNVCFVWSLYIVKIVILN